LNTYTYIEVYYPLDSGSVSLVELAIDQKGTNYGLLTIYHQLATLMHAVLTFNLKSVKVLSLFDSKVKHYIKQ